jgi:hypothetical protein
MPTEKINRFDKKKKWLFKLVALKLLKNI